ncbi:hypothetical protein ACFWBR_04510 [Streptomyces sp. NPDC060006]|uniref:hypothetical protein n=1 Tax=unclassified Streptomyces TaxID=2593676 RepID=UPI0036CCA790
MPGKTVTCSRADVRNTNRTYGDKIPEERMSEWAAHQGPHAQMRETATALGR